MAAPNSSYSDLRGSVDPVDIINDPKQAPHPQATLFKNWMMNFKTSLLKLISFAFKSKNKNPFLLNISLHL